MRGPTFCCDVLKLQAFRLLRLDGSAKATRGAGKDKEETRMPKPNTPKHDKRHPPKPFKALPQPPMAAAAQSVPVEGRGRGCCSTISDGYQGAAP